MNHMQLIICETKGDWAAELSRRLPAGISLIETRSLDEMWERLNHAPTATVALQLTQQRAEQILAALTRIDQNYPHTVAIVLADRSLAAWEHVVHEAGAIHIVVSPRQIDEIAALLLRRSQFAAADTPTASSETTSLEERILASLPWGD
jgi:hypothetical protein